MSELKAYAVQEDSEMTGGIVFALSNAHARRIGSSRFGDGNFNWGKAQREKQFDRFAPDPVPAQALIDAGWWFTCAHCERRISDGECDEETGAQIDFEDCPTRWRVFCGADCANAFDTEHDERQIMEMWAADWLKARFAWAVPGAEVTDAAPWVYAVKVDGLWFAQQAIISFRFPGCAIGTGKFRFDEIGERPHVTVCAGDFDAWNAWCARKDPLTPPLSPESGREGNCGGGE